MDKNIRNEISSWPTNVNSKIPVYEKNTINKTASFRNDFNNRFNDKSIFNRANSNRHSKIKSDHFFTEKHSNDHNQWAYCNQNIETQFLYKIPNLQGQLGIHVIPSYDITTQKDMGLIIQCIEQNGRIFKDGCLNCGDRIVEINNTTIIGVNFENAQEILRNAMKGNELLMKVVREDEKSMVRNTTENEHNNTIDVGNYNGYNESNNSDCKTHNNLNINKEIQIELMNINDTSKDDEMISYCNSNKTDLNALNTKRMGKKIHVQLTKGPQGLGFKLAARDNPTGEISPIYIKNILPKGAAITDGRLQRGDRLLEVNSIDMTQRNLHEAVAILRNTKLGSLVDIVVSRQIQEFPREISNEEHEINQQTENIHRELLTYEIALNDTGSAGLGVSVKGKTKKVDDNETTIDLGIFIKTVINGGAASKDGRLKPNDQLININGFSLLGKSNEEAMKILRDAMQVETKPGYIQLTISRKIRHSDSFKSNVPRVIEKMTNHVALVDSNDLNKKYDDSKHALDSKCMQFQTNKNAFLTEFENILTGRNYEKDFSASNNDEVEEVKKSFRRDAPARRSMSEKRKIYNDPNHKTHFYKNLRSSKNFNEENNNLTDFIRVGSFESVISRPGETKSNIHLFTTPVKQYNQLKDSMKTNENKTCLNVSHLNQQYLQMIETKNKSNDKSKSITQYNINNINNIIKSVSVESIPSIANINNNKKIDDIKLNGNTMDIKDNGSMYNENFQNFESYNNDFYPLTNILNRQRTINRSFRNAVDKSFDKPSEIFDDFNNRLESTKVNRMHHLRMSSQSDDTRKLKKSKKGIIETFQNFFKTNKRQPQEQKCPVQLLTYQHKNCDMYQNQLETVNNETFMKQSSNYNDEKHFFNNEINCQN